MTPQQKLILLRQQWQAHPEKRDIIELQAKIVKKSMNYVIKTGKEDLQLQSDIVSELSK